MDLDAGLLQRDKEKEQASEQRSGNLREVRRQAEDGSSEQFPSLRQTVIAAKRERLKKEASSEQSEELTSTPISKATSRVLRQAWLHLIDSFGLTFIWINIHAFLHLVLGDKIFCKLGHEWADLAPTSLNSAPGLKEAQQRASKIESMGVGLVDLIIILVLLGIVFVFYIIMHPYEVGFKILGDILKSWGVSWLA